MNDILPLSFLIGLGFIFINNTVSTKWSRNLRNSPQTMHKKSVSRFGGIAVFFSLLIISTISDLKEYQFLREAVFVSSPVFLLGLADDFNIEIKPALRLAVLFMISLLFYYVLGIKAYNLNIPFVDYLFTFEIFALLFICFAVAGMINAFNMIDGINGLLMLFCLSVCLSILIFPQSAINLEFYLYLVALFFAILGVFILNFPFGRIFLGDGGAYFLGAMIVIGLIKYYQVNDLSPWYVMLMLVYPVTDVLFSIYRRITLQVSTLEPDNQHLHHLIYKRVSKLELKSENKKHFLVTFMTFIIYSPFLLGANYFSKDTQILQILTLIFVSIYIVIYFLLAPRGFLRNG
ncbi:MAG: glycosyltransferase family 4 protein [Gammaproteobacteria bacterium]|uniref:Undecaprenyl/decaprenyl-phosphate alpha-N-acetylglucosaminyl 1-phosphate transferase n=1 Tax=SAR86 cluster bacterium TaxID=2030880 RepID=A0A520MZC3_9GAMM|nr:hypothetical protein [SAR86 cluster bacterium]RZO26582.1 MAG: hypothetical protein EVA92_02225 [SAR86 cluster bacterium]|tara:strand:- start:1865 stop:2905 length:1041 start_codon:yes stop_codon:yes gene_type:complete